MPKSRRAKVVPLTKIKAKTRGHKDALIERVREAVGSFEHMYTVEVRNARTDIVQRVREECRGTSRLILGSNKVMMVAIGRDEAASAEPNLYKLSEYLTGMSGLFFTNLGRRDVKAYLMQVGGRVAARGGQEATRTVVLGAGPLAQFPHSMHEHLSRLGLPVKLDKGVVVLEQETTVCTAGTRMSADAAGVLRALGEPMCEFGVDVTAHWTRGVGGAWCDDCAGAV